MTEDKVDIPPFLKRNPDNTLPDVRPSEAPPMTSSRADARTAGGSSDGLAQPPEWPSDDEFEQVRKKKSYGRLAKMKAKQADKAAVKAGKTWDPNKAEWV